MSVTLFAAEEDSDIIFRHKLPAPRPSTFFSPLLLKLYLFFFSLKQRRQEDGKEEEKKKKPSVGLVAEGEVVFVMRRPSLTARRLHSAAVAA